MCDEAPLRMPMSFQLDRDPEFARYKAAWVNYQQVQAEGIEAGTASGPTSYLQAQLEPSNVELHVAAVELGAARDAYLTTPTESGNGEAR
jgi:hypothetical protein